MKNPKVVTIGGGTGSFVVLTGLKKYPLDLTAIVTMMDSGGSSGKLRDELGVLPPGDIRQCLVALSKSTKLLRDLFIYRFKEGGLKGHTFGNIFLSALEKSTGSMKKAIEEIGKILHIQGRVVPVTFSKSDLCVELEDGKTIIGETYIDVLEQKIKRAKIKRAFLKPKVKANPDAIAAIREADFIVIGPGDLYTSIIPNLLVDGIPQAIKKSKAKKLFVMNLMTKYGQTTHYKASDHLKDLEKYLQEGIVETIILNVQKPKKNILSWYEQYEEEVVENDLNKRKVIKSNLLKEVLIKDQKNDLLRRGIIRHDADKLAKEIVNQFPNQKRVSF